MSDRGIHISGAGRAAHTRVLRPRARRGLPLVEVIMALAIAAMISLGVSSLLFGMANGTKDRQELRRRNAKAEVLANRLDTAIRSSAMLLGRDMLEEITSRAYAEPVSAPAFGPEFGEINRALYDDVDDYNGLSEARGAVATVEGALYAAQDQQFARAVTVTAGAINVADLGRNIIGLTVVVTLTAEGGERWQFTRFIPEL